MTAELVDANFAVVRRGYDRAQVEANLNRLGAELGAVAAARDAAAQEAQSLARQLEASRNEAHSARSSAAEVYAELDKLRAQVIDLSTIPSTVDGMSERLQQLVRIAQDEVNDMRTRATTSAAQVLTLAQAEADELRDRSANERRAFEADRREAEEALRSQLEASQARLDQLRSESEGQRARLATELAEQREVAEKELAAEMEERRSVVMRELADEEARRREEASRIIDAATEEARSRLVESTGEAQRIRAEAGTDVDAAQRELDDLRVLQHQVSEQLTSVRALLDWTLPQLTGAARQPGTPAVPPVAIPAAPPVAVAPVSVPPAVAAQPVAATTNGSHGDTPGEDSADTSGDTTAVPQPRSDAASPVADAGPDGAAAPRRPTPMARDPRVGQNGSR